MMQRAPSYRNKYRTSSLLSATQPRRGKKPLKIAGLILLLATVGGLIWIGKPSSSAGSANHPTTQSQQNAVVFDKTAYSIDNPASPWLIVNKRRPLNPATYTPGDLTAPDVPLKNKPTADESKLNATTAGALKNLFAGAKKDGINLMLVSGYRSYNFQKGLFDYYVRTEGRQSAEQQSAHAGYSEHQTGWAADVGSTDRTCEVDPCFADTPAGKWLGAHAYEYGFVVRYPQGSQSIVGYEYEPWHIRYVGVDLAQELHRTNTLTLEEFFGLPAAPDY